MSGSLFGYEWTYTCPECEEVNELAGLMGVTPIINGEKEYRTRRLEPGDTIECGECGAERTFDLR